MRFADTALQNTMQQRTAAHDIAAPQPDLDANAEKKHDFAGFLKRLLIGKPQANAEN